MTDLIRRLEEASEGSRELSLEFLRAITGKPWRFCLDGEAVIWDKYGPGSSGNPVRSLEDFTTNLQDAVSAVPDGWRWLLRQDPNCYRAALNRGPISDLRVMRGEAPTPSLALCIAILRAMEAKDE
jgi:hypothetical protein